MYADVVQPEDRSTSALYHYNVVSKVCLDERRDYGFVDGRRCESKCGILEGSNHTSSCHPSQTTASWITQLDASSLRDVIAISYLSLCPLSTPVRLYWKIGHPVNTQPQQVRSLSMIPRFQPGYGTCIFCRASVALECFSHSICRTLIAVAAFRAPFPYSKPKVHSVHKKKRLGGRIPLSVFLHRPLPFLLSSRSAFPWCYETRVATIIHWHHPVWHDRRFAW